MPAACQPRAPLAAREHDFLRRAFDLAQRALAAGERPFGAVIVDPNGAVLAEAHPCAVTDKDASGHAEVTAIRALRGRYGRDLLARSTLYSSAEPCAMCAGAIYWANIGRVVFGLTEQRLRALRNVSATTSALTMGCEAVLASGGHPTEVIGGVLEDEAIVPHVAFWAEAAPTRGHRTR